MFLSFKASTFITWKQMKCPILVFCATTECRTCFLPLVIFNLKSFSHFLLDFISFGSISGCFEGWKNITKQRLSISVFKRDSFNFAVFPQFILTTIKIYNFLESKWGHWNNIVVQRAQETRCFTWNYIKSSHQNESKWLVAELMVQVVEWVETREKKIIILCKFLAIDNNKHLLFHEGGDWMSVN